MPEDEDRESSHQEHVPGYKQKNTINPSNTPRSRFNLRALKCTCGDVLTSGMSKCPGCGRDAEEVIEEVRNRFYRANFGTSPEKKGEEKSSKKNEDEK